MSTLDDGDVCPFAVAVFLEPVDGAVGVVAIVAAGTGIFGVVALDDAAAAATFAEGFAGVVVDDGDAVTAVAVVTCGTAEAGDFDVEVVVGAEGGFSPRFKILFGLVFGATARGVGVVCEGTVPGALTVDKGAPFAAGFFDGFGAGTAVVATTAAAFVDVAGAVFVAVAAVAVFTVGVATIVGAAGGCWCRFAAAAT